MQFQFDLADLYGNLAASQRETGQLDAALRSIELSVRTSERAAARNPDFVAHRFNFAGALSQLGRVQQDRAAFGEAIRAFRRSIELFNSVSADQRDPTQVLAAKSGLGEALAGEAARSQSATLWREAKATFEEALAGWRVHQNDGGATDTSRAEIARIVSALEELDQRKLEMR